MDSNTLVINFFGGPGSGKSTQAAGLFYHLKMAGVNAELVTEAAKDYVWEENWTGLKCQMRVTSEQLYRQERLEGKVDVIVTDSPIILGILYYPDLPEKEYLENLILTKFYQKWNYNVFMERGNKFSQEGRIQNKDEAIKKDAELLDIIDKYDIQVEKIPSTKNGLAKLVNIIKELILV